MLLSCPARAKAALSATTFSVWKAISAAAAAPNRAYCLSSSSSSSSSGGDGNSFSDAVPAKTTDSGGMVPRRVRVPKRDLIVPKTCAERYRDYREALPTNVSALEYTLSNPKDSSKQVIRKRLFEKPMELSYETNRPIADPFARIGDQFKLPSKRKTKFYKPDVDAFYDVVIIGGGIMGCSVAYWLAQRVYEGLNILVVERDPTYRRCATTLSAGCIRQQFSMEENIEMSLFGADFIRRAKRTLHVHGIEMPNVNFQPHGFLFLATEKGADQLQRNYAIQNSLGARVELLSPSAIKQRFPWINVDDIALGSYGIENEGYFDPWALMTMFKIKAQELGVTFVHGDVYNMSHTISNKRKYYEGEERAAEADRLKERITEAHIYLHDGDVWPVDAAEFIIAAGPQSGHIGYLAGMGCGKGVMSVPVPVEPRKRYVYCVHAPKGPGLNCPIVIDPSGVYFRREGYGGHYLTGRSPAFSEEPQIDDLDVDYDWFQDKVWPVLAHRVPAFNELKVHSAWAGYYDYNYWDENALIGQHPHHTNVYLATGFSGHGLQQAPAVGRAIMELVLDHDYQTLDLTRLQFDRVFEDIRAEEINCV